MGLDKELAHRYTETESIYPLSKGVTAPLRPTQHYTKTKTVSLARTSTLTELNVEHLAPQSSLFNQHSIEQSSTETWLDTQSQEAQSELHKSDAQCLKELKKQFNQGAPFIYRLMAHISMRLQEPMTVASLHRWWQEKSHEGTAKVLAIVMLEKEMDESTTDIPELTESWIAEQAWITDDHARLDFLLNRFSYRYSNGTLEEGEWTWEPEQGVHLRFDHGLVITMPSGYHPQKGWTLQNFHSDPQRSPACFYRQTKSALISTHSWQQKNGIGQMRVHADGMLWGWTRQSAQRNLTWFRGYLDRHVTQHDQATAELAGVTGVEISTGHYHAAENEIILHFSDDQASEPLCFQITPDSGF